MTARSFDKLKSYISSLMYKQDLPDEKEQSQIFFRINLITVFIQIFDSLQKKKGTYTFFLDPFFLFFLPFLKIRPFAIPFSQWL